MTCAPPASFAPVGISRPSACSVAAGSSPPSENSIGARSGGAISCAAETATRQSVASTSVTARGRVSSSRDGIDGLRDRRGVGDRVGAAHARRVARGEGREAELGRRLLVVAALAERPAPARRRRRRRRRVAAVVAAAAAAGEHQQERASRVAAQERASARPRTLAAEREDFARRNQAPTAKGSQSGRLLGLRSPPDLVQCPAKPNPRRDSGGRGNQFVGANRDLSVAGRRLFQRQPVS